MEKTYYDLTPAQGLLIMSQKATVHKQVNNICTSVLIEKELDFNILKEAIKVAYDRNDALKLRITKVGKDLKQYFSDNGLQEIETLDFTGTSPEFMDEKLHRLAEKPITHNDKPLSKIYCLKSYDGKTGIFFIVSHMALDSWGITLFYKDLLKIYETLITGGEMPKPLVAYSNFIRKELDYKNTPEYPVDRDFWEKLLYSSEPIYADINGSQVLEKYREKHKRPDSRYAQTFTLYTKSKNQMLWFPKEVVDKVKSYCTDNRLSMQSLFLLAFRSYFSKVNNRLDDIYFLTSIARRGTLEEKNTGGSLVQALPFRTIFEEGMTIKEALGMIEEQKTKMYRHANMDPTELLGMVKKKFETPSIGAYTSALFTYQPVQLTTNDGTQIHSNWYGNGTFPMPIYLTVMDGDGTGGLKGYYEYQTRIIKEETLNKFHSYLINSMLTAVENDQLTLGQLLDVD